MSGMGCCWNSVQILIAVNGERYRGRVDGPITLTDTCCGTCGAYGRESFDPPTTWRGLFPLPIGPLRECGSFDLPFFSDDDADGGSLSFNVVDPTPITEDDLIGAIDAWARALAEHR